MKHCGRSVITALALLAASSGLAGAQTRGSSQPKAPFPGGAKIAFVDLNYVFATSREGKTAATELQALQNKKKADIAARTKEVQALEQKLAESATVLSGEARGRLERDVARAKVDFERLMQDSQAEVQEKQQQFERAFSRKLFPAIGEIAEARDLWAVFSVGQENLLWHQPALDISDELVARIDAGR